MLPTHKSCRSSILKLNWKQFHLNPCCEFTPLSPGHIEGEGGPPDFLLYLAPVAPETELPPTPHPPHHAAHVSDHTRHMFRYLLLPHQCTHSLSPRSLSVLPRVVTGTISCNVRSPFVLLPCPAAWRQACVLPLLAARGALAPLGPARLPRGAERSSVVAEP